MGLRQSSANQQTTSYPSIHYDTQTSTLQSEETSNSKKKLTEKDLKSLDHFLSLTYGDRVLVYNFQDSATQSVSEPDDYTLDSLSTKSNNKSSSKQKKNKDLFDTLPKSATDHFRAVNSTMYHKIKREATPHIVNTDLIDTPSPATTTTTSTTTPTTSSNADLSAALISLQEQADELELMYGYGGRGNFRLFSQMAFQTAPATIIVVPNHKLSGESNETLKELKSTVQSFIYNPSLSDKPLLILLQSDNSMNDTVRPQQLAESLHFSNEQGLKNRDWRIQTCSLADHSGLLSALTWLNQMMKRQSIQQLQPPSKSLTKNKMTKKQPVSKLQQAQQQEQVTVTEFPSVEKAALPSSTTHELPAASSTVENIANETINVVPAAA